MSEESRTPKIADVIDFVTKVESISTKETISQKKASHCNKVLAYIYRKNRDVVLKNLYKSGAL